MMPSANRQSASPRLGQRFPDGGLSSIHDQGAADLTAVFASELIACGIGAPTNIHPDGVLRRFRGLGDRVGACNAWYVLRIRATVAIGHFGSWRLGISERWLYRSRGRQPLPITHCLEMIKDRGKPYGGSTQDHAHHQTAAGHALSIWRQATAADPFHPYLVAKRVGPHSLRQRGGQLLVPLVDFRGTIWSLQTIDATHQKRFLKGGRVGGLFAPLGQLEAPARLIICEG